MAKNKQQNKNQRPNIENHVKLQLWNDAGGRCEFRGCNKKLWIHGLTFEKANFSEMAHIIGAKKDGPRGNDESEALAKDVKNLMLMCPVCHSLIDKPETRANYAIELLQEMKQEHEERITSLTEIGHNYKTEILRFVMNIGDRPVTVDYNDARLAVVKNKKYPQGNGIFIDRTQDAGDGDKSYYEYNCSAIKQALERQLFHEGNEVRSTNHLSVFALAPIPFLIFLGRHLTDTKFNEIELYQKHRIPKQTWVWDEKVEKNSFVNFVVKKPKSINPDSKVALILALSDSINEDKYKDILTDEFDIFTITISEQPNPMFLIHPILIGQFEVEFRKTLNEIQNLYGVNTTLHLFPAIPPPIAVKCGMTILPKKDMPILIYDFNKMFGGFRKTIVID